MSRSLTLLFIITTALSGIACDPDDDADDTLWSEAFDASRTGWMLSVAGPSSDDLYAVGGTPEVGRIMHFDGGSWSPVELGLEVPLLNWVHAFASDDIVVVGNEATILRYDGDTWSQDTPPEPDATLGAQDLWGVWGASSDDLWAVGGNGRMEGQATIYRNTGGGWEVVPVPELQRPGVNAFFKVWGTASDNVYIVGQRGIILHWDGAQLVEQSAGLSEDLIALWGTGPDNIVAVGGRNNGVMATFDGSTWEGRSLAPLPGVNGVWLGSPGRAHIAANSGVLGLVDLETFQTLRPPEVDTTLSFHAIFGDGDRLTAVGGNFQFVDGPYDGIALSRSMTDDD